MSKFENINSIINSTPKKKTYSETESRVRLMRVAKQMGCDKELKLLFIKYDKLMGECKNEQERKHISILGISEVNKLMSFEDSVIIDDEKS